MTVTALVWVLASISLGLLVGLVQRANQNRYWLLNFLLTSFFMASLPITVMAYGQAAGILLLALLCCSIAVAATGKEQAEQELPLEETDRNGAARAHSFRGAMDNLSEVIRRSRGKTLVQAPEPMGAPA